MNKNIAKNTLAMIAIIRTPVELKRYGETVYKEVNKALNTSLFSKSFVGQLKNAEIRFEEVQCDNPYALYSEVERSNIVEYAVFIDKCFLECGSGYRHSIAIFCGWCDRAKHKLLITAAVREAIKETRGR